MKKAYTRWSLSTIAFAVFSVLLLSQLIQDTNRKLRFQDFVIQSQVLVQKKTASGLPMRLIIPAINVNASIQQVGITSEGAMGVPSNAVDVGWFKLRSRPGEKGNAIIGGHFDGENGETGVFTNLYKLKKGDKLYVKDDKENSITFVVRESRTYDPGYADDVFNRSDGIHLNLITCDGAWDGAKKSYNKRLVVFADILH